MRTAAAIALGAALLASCETERRTAAEVLADTAANLREIRSGELSIRMLTAIDDDPESRVGFELAGPFSLASSAPVARLTYTQFAGPEEATATFISTGSEAFVDDGLEPRRLPTNPMAEFAAEGGTAGGADLPIAHWLREPRLSDGGLVGGARTHRVNAELDVPAALADLVSLAASFGAPAPAGTGQLGDAERAHLERAVRSSRIEVYTGVDDLLLRRLEIEAVFAAEPPGELAGSLDALAGVRFSFELAIDEPNRPVETPEAPLP